MIFSETLYEIAGQYIKKSDTARIFKKILIWGLRGNKCQDFGFLDIFSETGH